MKNLFRVLCGVSVMSMIPAVAGAVGTYYNGNLYQNPQQRYSRGGYYNSYGYGSGRNNYAQGAYGNRYNNQYGVERQLGMQKQQMQNKKQTQQTTVKQGLILDAGVSHEMGSWEFDMNNAGSKLHYDNLAWNVFDAKGVYYFGDNTKMQINAGFRYGMQYGDSPMIDDDMSSDKAIWVESGGVYNVKSVWVENNFLVGNPAMSVGTSKDGSQFGYNVGLGLTDFFTWGNMKITPSIGYRYFRHKLTTQKNKGMAVGVFSALEPGENDLGYTLVNCMTMDGSDEMQCVPYVVFGNYLLSDGSLVSSSNNYYPLYGGLQPVRDQDGNGNVFVDENGNVIAVAIQNTGMPYLDMPGTYYYEQPGTSHEYETEWYGPYLALDMEYQINQNNLVTGGIELGLPIYDSKGNQPYRWDWAHPTSVEDKGDFGDAYHLGLNANWKTAITDSTYLSLGFTFDYYKVSDATANTYLNGSLYQSYLDEANILLETYPENEDLLRYKTELESYRAAGWKIEEKKEINSIYKSMGIRIGLSMKF